MNDMVIRDKKEIAYYETNKIRNKIIWGDALEVLRKIPEQTFDMVFVDPPYFLQLPEKKLKRWSGTIVEGVSDKWDKFRDFKHYDEFTTKWLVEVKRVMKKEATLWVIGTYHNIYRVGKIMQDLGYWILNDVIWVKTNPVPNFLGVRFTNATETLIWAVKDKTAKRYTFNKEYARKFGIGKVGANVWVLPICNGQERIKDEKGLKIHSTQKPIELLKRVILTSTKEGDLILDPMAGTGTTGYVAKAFNRDYVMVEINPKYVEAMENRFKIPARIYSGPSGRKIFEYINVGEI